MRALWSCSKVAVAAFLSALSARPVAAADLGHWTAGGFAEVYPVFKLNDATPRQRTSATLALLVDGDIGNTLRAHFDVRSQFGGTVQHPDGGGFINLDDTFQNTSPAVEIEEGYVDVLLPNLDLRLGKQKFAWGRLDLFHPTDVVNPRRYTDPFVMDDEDRKIGVPSVRATYYPPALGAGWPSDLALALLWVPWPVATRFPLEDERWFPSSIGVPASLHLGGHGLPATDVATTLRTENVSPPHQLDEGAAAVRLTGLAGGVDWSLCYYDGPETFPTLTFTTEVSAPLAKSKLAAGQPVMITDLTQLDALATLRPQFTRMRLVGGDLALRAGGFSVRAEADYGFHRQLPRSTDDLLSVDNIAGVVRPQLGTLIPQLARGESVPIDLGDLFVARDVVEWGIGADYPYGDWTPILQVNQMIILDNHIPLLINDVDTRLLAILRTTFLAERLKSELVGFQGLERSYTGAVLRLTYAVTDAVRVRLGALLIAGSRHTLVGQYQDNDEIFVQVRYSF